MTLRGLDVSGFQSVAEVAAVIDRYDWIGVYATEGLHTTNPLHAAQVALARSRGKGVLHYHFLHPGEDVRAQWAFFRSFAQWRPGDMLACDSEQTDGLPWVTVAAQVATFLTTGRADSGAHVWDYLNLYWKSALAATPSARILESFPLWLADYTRDPTVFGDPRPWPNLTCEQWTDRELGHLDGDVFLGDWAAWRALAVPQRIVASPIPPALTTSAALAATKEDLMSQTELVGQSNWREIPIPDDGRTYAVSLCFAAGGATAGVEFLAFKRRPTVETPSVVSRSGSWPKWQRDVPGRITLRPGEGAISVRFHGTPDQTLSIVLYPVS